MKNRRCATLNLKVPAGSNLLKHEMKWSAIELELDYLNKNRKRHLIKDLQSALPRRNLSVVNMLRT